MELPAEQTPENLTFFQRNKNLIKGFLISFLILALLIPTFFVMDLVRERQQRNQEVKQEIAQQWGSAQTLTGPLLAIPYWQQTTDADNKTVTVKKLAYFLPETLKVQGNLQHEYRERSAIFKLIVYTAQLSVDGSFSPLSLSKLNIPASAMLPSEAFILYGLSDYTGIQQQMKISWDGKEYEFNAGTNQTAYLEKGLHTPIALQPEDLNKAHTFSMKVALRGSEDIYFSPLGKSTEVSLTSSWPHPSFLGKTLPEHHITDKGFSAGWKAFDLNREFAQQWKEDAEVNFAESAFGVSLLQPLDNYGKTTRTVKYAILVIMLTFVLYFFIEVLQKRSVHAVQYVLIGFALIIFYTLLLSISEYTGFANAYLLSAGATILLISAYTRSVFGSLKTAALFGSFLTALYVFIFTLIQLQDGALLAGSIGLFLILAAIMYFSRKIEWYK